MATQTPEWQNPGEGAAELAGAARRQAGPWEQTIEAQPGAADAQKRFDKDGRLTSQGTQTSIHDSHNHSNGPGYTPHQVYNQTKTLAQNIEAQLPLFDQAGVDRYILMPIPTNIVSGKRSAMSDHDVCGCGSRDTPARGEPQAKTRSYYTPQSVRKGEKDLTGELYDAIVADSKQYYATGVNRQLAAAYSQLSGETQKRVVPSLTGINPGDANCVFDMMAIKRDHPGTFSWIGEMTIHKEFVDRQNADYQPDFSDRAPMHDVLDFAGRSGMGVTIHCDADDVRQYLQARDDAKGSGEPFADDASAGRCAHTETMRALIKAHPDTTIVWAHLGGVARFAPASSAHLNELRKTLTECPNAHVDMSWDVVAKNFAPPPPLSSEHSKIPQLKAQYESEVARKRDAMDQLGQLITDFPDRFLMGSDSLVAFGKNSISDTYGLYMNQGAKRNPSEAGLFDRLSGDTQQKVLSGNFERLVEDAKQKSLAYEAGSLGSDLHKLQEQKERASTVPNLWDATTGEVDFDH